MLLAGCAHPSLATLSDGACKAFPRPVYRIKGATRYDQKWADETTEAGVAGCHWPRPTPRPASLDPMPVKALPMRAPSAEPAPVPDPQIVAPSSKPTLRERLRRWRKKF